MADNFCYGYMQLANQVSPRGPSLRRRQIASISVISPLFGELFREFGDLLIRLNEPDKACRPNVWKIIAKQRHYRSLHKLRIHLGFQDPPNPRCLTLIRLS